MTLHQQKLQWQTAWSRVAFHPRKFREDAGEKVSLALITDELLYELGEALDQWALTAARMQAIALFGKSLSAEEIAKAYTPLIRKSDDLRPLFRAKIWLQGPQQVRVWDCRGRCTLPENLRDFEVRAQLVLKGLWFHSGRFGLTVETQALQVKPWSEDTRCPFI